MVGRRSYRHRKHITAVLKHITAVHCRRKIDLHGNIYAMLSEGKKKNDDWYREYSYK